MHAVHCLIEHTLKCTLALFCYVKLAKDTEIKKKITVLKPLTWQSLSLKQCFFTVTGFLQDWDFSLKSVRI